MEGNASKHCKLKMSFLSYTSYLEEINVNCGYSHVRNKCLWSVHQKIKTNKRVSHRNTRIHTNNCTKDVKIVVRVPQENSTPLNLKIVKLQSFFSESI